MSRLSIVLILFCGAAALLVSPVFSAARSPDRNRWELKESIPQDPECIIGRLENGPRYYIRVNGEPEKRAYLCLAVNAGSILACIMPTAANEDAIEVNVCLSSRW